MKKLIIFLSVLTLLQNTTLASEAQYYCSKEPYDLSKGFGSVASSITGTNFLVKQFAQKEIAKVLSKELNGKFKVKINTFGGSNLQNGKFKKLTAQSKSIENNGMYFTDLKVETLCDFNHVKYENNTLYFVENMVIEYNGKVSASDLKKTIQSPEYLKAIDKISISSKGKSLAKILNHDIAIKNNKIIMSYDLFIPLFLGTIPKHIEFSADLKVDNGRIIFADIDFGNSAANAAMKSAIPMINLLNPFIYQVKIDDNNNAIINVKKVEIINNEIIVNGIILIPQNYRK